MQSAWVQMGPFSPFGSSVKRKGAAPDGPFDSSGKRPKSDIYTRPQTPAPSTEPYEPANVDVSKSSQPPNPPSRVSVDALHPTSTPPPSTYWEAIQYALTANPNGLDSNAVASWIWEHHRDAFPDRNAETVKAGIRSKLSAEANKADPKIWRLGPVDGGAPYIYRLGSTWDVQPPARIRSPSRPTDGDQAGGTEGELGQGPMDPGAVTDEHRGRGAGDQQEQDGYLRQGTGNQQAGDGQNNERRVRRTQSPREAGQTVAQHNPKQTGHKEQPVYQGGQGIVASTSIKPSSSSDPGQTRDSGEGALPPGSSVGGDTAVITADKFDSHSRLQNNRPVVSEKDNSDQQFVTLGKLVAGIRALRTEREEMRAKEEELKNLYGEATASEDSLGDQIAQLSRRVATLTQQSRDLREKANALLDQANATDLEADTTKKEEDLVRQGIDAVQVDRERFKDEAATAGQAFVQLGDRLNNMRQELQID